MNSQNVNPNDIIAYQARLALINKRGEIDNNVKPSKNMQEHKQLEAELSAQLRQILLDIDSSQMSLANKIVTANEAERYFNSIVANDVKQMERKRILMIKKIESIRNLMQQKLNSESLTPEQKNKIAEYKKRKATQKKKWIALMIVSIVLTLITVGFYLLFFTKWAKKSQEQEYTDSDWKKQKEIVDGAKHETNNEFTNDLAKQLLGNGTSTVTLLKDNNSVKEFTITTDDVTTYYKYDKSTDTLMSKSTSDGTYTKVDKGDNYLANYYADDGGVIAYDNRNIEKIVKVGNDTYKYDYKTQNIIKNDQTYSRYKDGEPLFVKAYKSDYKHFVHAGWAPSVAFGIAALAEGIKNVLDNGDDKKVKEWQKQDENYQQQKQNMKLQYNNTLGSGSGINIVGSGVGDTYARAIQKLQNEYNNFNVQENMANIGDVTDLEVEQIANGME